MLCCSSAEAPHDDYILKSMSKHDWQTFSASSRSCCTFFACCVLGVQIPAHCHHLNQEPVASLADHVDHLSMAHLHHILLVHLPQTDQKFSYPASLLMLLTACL